MSEYLKSVHRVISDTFLQNTIRQKKRTSYIYSMIAVSGRFYSVLSGEIVSHKYTNTNKWEQARVAVQSRLQATTIQNVKYRSFSALIIFLPDSWKDKENNLIEKVKRLKLDERHSYRIL